MDAESHLHLLAAMKGLNDKRMQRRGSGPGVNFGFDRRNAQLR
jgi:hypothetical protein